MKTTLDEMAIIATETLAHGKYPEENTPGSGKVDAPVKLSNMYVSGWIHPCATRGSHH